MLFQRYEATSGLTAGSCGDGSGRLISRDDSRSREIGEKVIRPDTFTLNVSLLLNVTPNMPFDVTASLPRLRLGRLSACQRQR